MDRGSEEEGSRVEHDTYARDRTGLANERTFAAWIRTGIAALAGGLAIAKFLLGTAPDWGLRAVAALLVVFSFAAFIVAGWRYSHLHVRMAHLDVQALPKSLVMLLSLALAACSLVAMAAVLMPG